MNFCNKELKKLRPYKKYIGYSSLFVAFIIFALLGIKANLFSRVTTGIIGSNQIYADTCIAPTNYPPPPMGGMTYTNWYFDTSQSISSLQFTINIFNNPGNTSDEYLQLYDANIDNTGQYFGLQTTGTIIFSQWNTSDLSNIELGPGATEVNGTETGSQFISLRYDAGDLPVGQYAVNMTRTNYDGTGDWFAYYVTFPGQAQQYIGSIRFPRANPSIPASFHDGGGSWTEFWDNNNNATLYPVPLWHVNLEVRADNSLIPNSAISSYSTMPNSDIYAESSGGYVDFVIGGSTPRCHPAGYLWQNINQTPTSTTPTSTTTTPKTTTTTPKTTPTSTTTTPTTTPKVITPSLPSISITVVNSKGQKIVDAKVVLDNKQISYTNNQGIANFSAVSSGDHSITITRTGSKSTQEKITLTPGKNEILTVKLTKNTNNLIIYIAIAFVVIVLLIIASYFFKHILKRKNIIKNFSPTNPPYSQTLPTASTFIVPPDNNLNTILPSTATNSHQVNPIITPEMTVETSPLSSNYDPKTLELLKLNNEQDPSEQTIIPNPFK